MANAAEKADERIWKVKLANIGGPISCKTAVLIEVANSMLLNGSMVWQDALNTRNNCATLERIQRKILIRLVTTIKMIFAAPLQAILLAVPCIDLMVIECKNTYEGTKDQNTGARSIDDYFKQAPADHGI